MAELKANDPEVYRLWVTALRKRINHDMWMEKAPIRVPFTTALIGQALGLVAVLAVLGIAAYALYLDHGWIAAFLGALDIIGLAAVFNGNSGGRHRERRDS